jgi:Tol biopolymer transport system component
MRIGSLAVASLLALLVPGTAAAETAAPAGPRLAFFAFHPYPDLSDEVATVGPDGSNPLRLSGGSGLKAVTPMGSSHPSWPADGSVLAFTGGAGAGDPAIFTVNAGGTGLHLVRASRKIFFEGSPILSPSGRSVAVYRLDVISGHLERPNAVMARSGEGGEGVKARFAIWSLDTKGGGMRPLTPWLRRRAFYPSSYSPDGAALAATQRTFRAGLRPQAVSIDLRSGRISVLANNAKEPAYAPDGRIVAVRDHLGKPRHLSAVKSSDLLVGPPGGPLRKVLRVGNGIASPSWDPSSQRIAFATPSEASYLSSAAQGSTIQEVNADGTCPTTLLSLERGLLGGVAWQPGPGREAGRIAC